MAHATQLVIFDCDGVLVDSERLTRSTNHAFLAEHGWPISEAEITQRFLGKSEAFVHATMLEHLPEQPEGWWEDLQLRYHYAFERELEPVNGIVEALDAIDLPTCVASSGSHAKMRRTLNRTNLWDRFDGRIYSATQVERGKPEPDLFLFAAEQMGVAPHACVVVEDSRFGVEAALAAGMRPLAYTGGLCPPEQLALPGAVLFDDMRALPALIEQA
jgi:HAD superfamily hydrolase (TIGR01509 family)